MSEFKTKLYPHITGVGGFEGRPGVLAVTAALNPSPHYPEIGRLIIGTPVASDKVLGPLPDLGGFMMSVEGAENLIATLQQAVSDVRAATGARPPTRWEQGSHLDGFERIGRIDAVGRRSLWLKEESGAFELRAGREGDDAHVRIEQAGHDAPGEREAVLKRSPPLRNPPNPVVIKLSPSRFGVLNDVMTRARLAAEWEQKNGFALAATGIEVNGYEDHRDLVEGEAFVLTVAVIPPAGGLEVTCRIIVRPRQNFAVQYRAGDDDWRPVAFSAVGFTPDAVLASVMESLFGLLRTGVRIDLRRGETSPAAPGHDAAAKTSPADPGRERKDRDIHALWFDKNGCGPDELMLQLKSSADKPYPALGMRVQANGIVLGVGFMNHRDEIAELHRQLGAWLSSTDKTSPR